MRPVPEMYPVTQTYRQNSTIYNASLYHGAVDYGAPVNTPALAPEDGEIIHADWVWNLPGSAYDWESRDYQIKPEPGNTWTGGGIMVGIRNRVGSRWWIAHLNRTDMNPGDRVVKGQVIGYTGNTGSSTGPHAHVSLIPAYPNRNNGAFGAIDPAPYLTEKYEPRRYLAWQGGPTTGAGSTVAERDWFDMATKAELEEIVLGAVQRELTYPRQKLGPGVGGKVTIQDEILYLASNFRALNQSVSPAAITAAVARGIAESGADVPVDELADKVADRLLAKVTAAATVVEEV